MTEQEISRYLNLTRESRVYALPLDQGYVVMCWDQDLIIRKDIVLNQSQAEDLAEDWVLQCP